MVGLALKYCKNGNILVHTVCPTNKSWSYLTKQRKQIGSKLNFKFKCVICTSIFEDGAIAQLYISTKTFLGIQKITYILQISILVRLWPKFYTSLVTYGVDHKKFCPTRYKEKKYQDTQNIQKLHLPWKTNT